MTDKVKASQDASGRTVAAPAVLESVRARVQQRLGEYMKAMLENLDRVLFEWSRALPDGEQQKYMDVIGVVRRQHSDIEAQFASGIASVFMRLNQSESRGVKSGGLGDVDFSSLSLVNAEDMDVSVMIDSMVARARMEHAAALGLLRRRYGQLLPKLDLSERNMPLDPSPIANSFKDALSVLTIGVAERLLVLRVFQQDVLGQLGSVLDEANQLFVDAGVLPDLKVAFTSPAPAKRPPSRQDAARSSAGPAANTEEVFAMLQGLLGQGVIPGSPGMAGGGAGIPGAQFHGGQYVGGGGIGAVPASVIGGSVAAVPIAPMNIAPTAVVQTVATPELLSLLSQIQQQQPKAKLVEDDSTPTVEEVRGNIRSSLRSDAEAVEAIRQADEDIINLVSMLFDFILDDDDLPTAMKALIGRLQIPLLKVAILDKTFFNAESHPARRLLNALAKAGIGWSNKGQADDVLYAKIEEVVFRILNEFIDDLSLFDELLHEFTGFHEQQQKREEMVDKRTQEAEEGKARAELARAMVQQTLNRRMTGRQLPLVVVRLLQDAWRNVLYINCLKDGTESESWKQSVKVVDALIWSVLPQPGPEWQKRLGDVAPKLVNSLKKGLASVNYDVLKTETLLRELAQVHLGLMRGEEAHTVSILEARTAKAETPGQVAVSEVASSDATKVAAVVLPEAEPVPVATDGALASDDSNVLMVSRLNVGSWVEFIDPEKQDRHKLVARIRSVDKLIFANRRGIKVGEMTGMKLATDMSLGRARVVQEGEFIDRALEAVIGNLRDLGGKAAPAGKS